ncbi:MAG: RlmE family RNA methyltransferase [Desulfobacteraceae bacterium]|nr:MAG: RlmE family RNA methyltransferase [Desulfobacteraceae bacterium]
MKRSRKGKSGQWADHLTQQAKSDNYPARSVYKLMEIQKKFRVIQKNKPVLDLGCSPGSWLLYAAQQAGPQARVIGIDLKPVETALPGQATALVGDILRLEENGLLTDQDRFATVLSDMAPATTGRKDVDALKSFELCEMALKVAQDYLEPNGHFVCKIFQGKEFDQFNKTVKQLFKQCKIFKPESCRKSSKEIYIIGKDKK